MNRPAPDALRDVAAALDQILPGAVAINAPLGSRTTWRVGGNAAVTARAETVAQLIAVAAILTPDIPRFVLGRGSNVLVADAGFPGVVISLGSGFETVTFRPETSISTADQPSVAPAASDVGDRGIGGRGIGGSDIRDSVTAGGATTLPVLARQCAAAARAGLGFYVGIPGSVGGAIRMNAGGHGRETREVVMSAAVVDLDGPGELRHWDRDALGFGDRHSALGPSHVVVSACFAVALGDAGALAEEIREIVRWRAAHQPGGANAGSVFRNPSGDAAARLIDKECGLRGLRVGGAVISEKHANFIQTDAGGTAADVHQLIQTVRETVERQTGIRLDVEIHEIGFAQQ